MDNHVLFAVIMVQVLVFQFLALRLTRALPDSLVGRDGLPHEAARAVATFKRGAGRLRNAAGGVLWIAAILATYVLPLARTEAKLTLAVISLLSSAVLAVGLALDHRAVRAITAALPEPAVRSASLTKPSLAHHYPAVWEAAPVALFLVTLLSTLWAVVRVSGEHAVLSLYLLPTVQAVFVFGALFWSLHSARLGRVLPQRSRQFLGSVADGSAVAEVLIGLELRFFLAAKIGVTLMLGLMQAKEIVAATGHAVPRWLALAPWVMVFVLLALFIGYGSKLSSVKLTKGVRL